MSTLLIALGGDVEAVEFRIEGLLESVDFVPVPKGKSSNSLTQFAIDFRDCSWRIETLHHRRGGIVQYEVGYEGENVFTTMCIIKTNRTITQPAVIQPGPVPRVLGEEIVSAVWLAYGSICYSQVVTNSRAEGLFVHTTRNLLRLTNFSVPVLWKNMDTSPHFPEQVVYFEDGKLRYWERDKDYWAVPPSEIKLPAPYDKGNPDYDYQVKSHYVTNGLTIPQVFQFQMFKRKPRAARSNDMILASQTIGKATNIALRSVLQSFIPAAPKGTAVADARFERQPDPVHNMSYHIDGRWLNDDELKASDQYARQVELQSRLIPKILARPRKQQKAERARWVAFVVMVIIPIALFGIATMARRNRSTSVA